ncbi:unnamed protein product [Trypanosoma congolense IL3000]|uniref:WGS project CAEQ00000000 data, annotated contig 1173 n=1 Tax=Trypanosoma congolense (strain IL3000) TaxID=1068625 RepID=F9W4E1_TRYCI|nr:unnamed protein product [Trypanosoma congolense IL3000]
MSSASGTRRQYQHHALSTCRIRDDYVQLIGPRCGLCQARLEALRLLVSLLVVLVSRSPSFSAAAPLTKGREKEGGNGGRTRGRGRCAGRHAAGYVGEFLRSQCSLSIPPRQIPKGLENVYPHPGHQAMEFLRHFFPKQCIQNTTLGVSEKIPQNKTVVILFRHREQGIQKLVQVCGLRVLDAFQEDDSNIRLHGP